MPELRRKDDGTDAAPMAEAFFGQPESCFDMVNQYGTYNIQPTNESENLFPLIAQGLPEAWQDLAVGKHETEQQG